MERLEVKIKSAMNGIFRRLKLRINPKISSELINRKLTIYVEISEDKLVLMEMLHIKKRDIALEFFDKISKFLNSETRLNINKINIEYKIKNQ